MNESGTAKDESVFRLFSRRALETVFIFPETFRARFEVDFIWLPDNITVWIVIGVQFGYRNAEFSEKEK